MNQARSARARHRNATCTLRSAILIALALGISALGTAFAQSGRLEPGDETLATGELVDVHPYAGTAGTEIAITIVSADFDPYLIVVTPNGATLVEADDSAGHGLNVSEVVRLPEDGTYLIGVTSALPGETGAYELGIQAASAGARKAPATAAAASTSPASRATSRPGFVTGTVLDTQGRPLAGAGVMVWGATYEGGERVVFETTTGADGTYSVRVPDGRYEAKAWLDTTYGDSFFSLLMHPSSGDPYTAVDTEIGGNIDFQWRLSGLRAGRTPPGSDPTDFYGASIGLDYCGLPASAYCSDGYAVHDGRPIAPAGSLVRVTLVPVAPLVDGTAGAPLVVEFPIEPQSDTYPYVAGTIPGYPDGGGGRTVLGDGWDVQREGLDDIPLGIYDVTVEAILPGGGAQRFLVGTDAHDVSYKSVRIAFAPWEDFHARSYSGGGITQATVYVRD